MRLSRFLRVICVFCLLALLPLAQAKAGDLLVERQVFDYLTDTMGLNSAAACGVMANIEAESGFSLGALGDSGSSYGLCQWHNSRFDNLKSFCAQQGLDYWTLEGQMGYLSMELKTWYQSTYNVLRTVPNTPEGAYEAAAFWCIHFEAPADAQNAAVRRGNDAQFRYWLRYGSSALDSHGYSGSLHGSGSYSSSFYWESAEPEPTTAPSEPAPTQAPTEAPTEAPARPQQQSVHRFVYITHHKPPMRVVPRAPRLDPVTLLFFWAAPPAKKAQPLPEPCWEEVPA